MINGLKKCRFVWITTFMLVLALPAYAQADPAAAVEGFFTQIEDILRIIAASAAVIGVLGLAIMNMGSVFPVVSDWKKENPKAASQVTSGIVMMIFVGTGGLAALIALV
ncbi:MAG: hypothetical protein WBC91_19490 [Phototrophicaceae bacterium]